MTTRTRPDFSKAKTRIIADAIAAGHRVVFGDGHAVITATSPKRGVIVWERGMSTRTDVDLGSASGMTLADVRQFLNM